MCGSLYRFTERDLFFMAIYSNYSDQELSGLLKSGDQVVFTAIYNRYWEKMQGLPGAIPKIQDIGVKILRFVLSINFRIRRYITALNFESRLILSQ